MNALVAPGSALAQEASTSASGTECNVVLILALCLIVYPVWRSHKSEQAATQRARELSREERTLNEMQILEKLDGAESLDVADIAVVLSEHSAFAIEIVSTLVRHGLLAIVPDEGRQLGDSGQLDRSSRLALTPEGARTIRQRPPVVNMHNFGDTIHAGHGAVVNNRSVVNRSYNQSGGALDTEVAHLITELGEAVRRSGDRDAQDNVDALIEEIQRPEPRQGLIRSLLHGIQQALPAATQISDLVTRIRDLLS